MLERLLTRLNYILLRLYPDRFLDEFGGEMDFVFAEMLSGLDDSGTPPVRRKMRMIGLFFREVWSFPLAYLEARRYQFSLDAGETPANGASYGEGQVVGTWVSQRASWGEALVGTLPFLLFGLAYLLDGHRRPVFTLLGASLNHPAIMLTLPMGVYFACVLGLLFGALKGFPR
jgi:hypothetical protein